MKFMILKSFKENMVFKWDLYDQKITDFGTQ